MLYKQNQKHSEELLNKAIQKIQKSFYKKSSFWIGCSGIDGQCYGSYKQIGMDFIENQSYVCIEADGAPSFYLLGVVHIPCYQNPELYKELGIDTRYSNVKLTPDNITLIEKFGYHVTN
ncbi:hypothetical protein LAh9_35 [Aeromonas phage LAh_9]|uniref:Uncharacterized protein n=1 Tax=Aeromonas phage LAh_9 TaxID=2591033 RepID=A0A514A0Z5_9CAUD|nr:hypothetical protein HWC32_gp035 [Aeromonas phage LAh_9]QDH46943.1 hypothetical protein LAh9_35 [Aeromonas phage LAh_9]